MDEIRDLVAADSSSEDPVIHAKLLFKIHALNLAAETPPETIFRIGYQSWQSAAIRVALDLGIFDMLVKRAPNPVSAEELASQESADVVLIGMFDRESLSCRHFWPGGLNRNCYLLAGRTMRVITALGLCTEVGVGKYAANSKTEIMTVPQGATSFKFLVDMAMPAAAKLPEYLRTVRYQNPRDNQTTAFAHAFGAEFWTWLEQHPAHAETFNAFMASRRQGRPSWFDIYPVEQELSGPKGEEDAVTLVDIGGNQGHDLVNLKARFPNLQGRLVLQDLPHVVATADFGEVGSISAMGHNFFDPQPIRRT